MIVYVNVLVYVCFVVILTKQLTTTNFTCLLSMLK